jgi:hypothetical protein
MKKKQFISSFLMFALLIYSCKKENVESEQNEIKVSSSNSMESHNNGMDCISCHQKGSSGEGWFEVAGSVYDSTKTNFFPNATVKLYTQPNGYGSLIKTIEVDGKGNFYSTANIDFSGGLYPSVSSQTSTLFMSTSTNTGNCNSCHNVTQSKIWMK